jgi:hypothetical protein
MLTAANIHSETSGRVRGINHGGIGAIDRRLHVLKIHLPYHQSDHVLNLAYNPLCDGTCCQDSERRRHDENFLDALGARRLPDPTTAGDFCRRFTRDHLSTLLDVINDTRLQVWAKQPRAFFGRATIDMDGRLVATAGACKQGMDIAYDGTWGYHPLVLSLANTGEVLGLVNRSGNRPSHEGAAAEGDRALAVCCRGGFLEVLLRGDTDFSQTEHLDRWGADARVRFVFGDEAAPNRKAIADDGPASAGRPLERPARYEVRTRPRRRRDKVKEAIVKARGYENLRLRCAEVAEFDYRPTACQKAHRMVAVRKDITREKGERRRFDEVRSFFSITNDRTSAACDVVFTANDRCDQENLLAQLHSGVRALKAPSDTRESNWAYLVMTALAWNLKAWWALTLPERPGRWQEKHREEKQWVLRLEFKAFVSTFVRLPCQVVRTGRKLVYRLLGWNPHLAVFFRLVSVLRC